MTTSSSIYSGDIFTRLNNSIIKSSIFLVYVSRNKTDKYPFSETVSGFMSKISETKYCSNSWLKKKCSFVPGMSIFSSNSKVVCYYRKNTIIFCNASSGVNDMISIFWSEIISYNYLFIK